MPNFSQTMHALECYYIHTVHKIESPFYYPCSKIHLQSILNSNFFIYLGNNVATLYYSIATLEMILKICNFTKGNRDRK